MMCWLQVKRIGVPIAATNVRSNAHTLTRYIRLLCFLHGQISHSCSPLLYIKYINSKTQLKEFSRPDMLSHRKLSFLTNGIGMPWTKILKSHTLFFFFFRHLFIIIHNNFLFIFLYTFIPSVLGKVKWLNKTITEHQALVALVQSNLEKKQCV